MSQSPEMSATGRPGCEHLLRDEHLFRLAGLSEAERSVVNEAIEGDSYDGTRPVRSGVKVYAADLSHGGPNRASGVERPLRRTPL